MIRKSVQRFSLGTNAKRLPGDHAQTKKIERDDDSKKRHPAPGDNRSTWRSMAMKSLMSPVGAKTRREILGDEWVDSNSQNVTEFDRAWQMYVTNINWAGTWPRNIIPPQQ